MASGSMASVLACRAWHSVACDSAPSMRTNALAYCQRAANACQVFAVHPEKRGNCRRIGAAHSRHIGVARVRISNAGAVPAMRDSSDAGMADVSASRYSDVSALCVSRWRRMASGKRIIVISLRKPSPMRVRRAGKICTRCWASVARANPASPAPQNACSPHARSACRGIAR